uniref:Sorting nexin 3 n=1 Tax=Gadus morhua TaxID=8049 RepID=A0A8C5CV15_GADMO
MADTIADTRRLFTKPQNLNDAYGPPSNFLEIDVSNPETMGVGRGRFTTYEIRLKTNLPIFKLKESRVRRRYSDFEWLRAELERESKVVVPPLPGKALARQLPFRGDDGIFDDSFIEERRQGLEQFLNKRFVQGFVTLSCVCKCFYVCQFICIYGFHLLGSLTFYFCPVCLSLEHRKK